MKTLISLIHLVLEKAISLLPYLMVMLDPMLVSLLQEISSVFLLPTVIGMSMQIYPIINRKAKKLSS